MTPLTKFGHVKILLIVALGLTACSPPEIMDSSNSGITQTSPTPSPSPSPAPSPSPSPNPSPTPTTGPEIAITAPASDGTYVNNANKASFTLSGTCGAEGRAVAVSVDTASGSDTCESGAFSVTLDLSSVASGALTATATHADSYGNSTNATRSLIKDVANPTLTFGSTDPASPSTSATPKVIGSTSADTTLIELYLDASCATLKASGTKAAFEGSGISLTVPLSQASAIHGKATDAAGNTSACTSLVTYTNNYAPPSVAITTPASNGAYVNATSQGAFTVSGTCSLEGATVSVAVGTVTATPTCTSGAFSAALDLSSLSEGGLTATASQTDGQGGTGSASRSLTKDITAPTVAYSSLSPASPAASVNPSVIGTTSADTASVKLYLDASCTTEAASGTRVAFEGSGIAAPVPAAATSNIRAIAVDAAGNSSSCTAMTSYVNTAAQLNGTYTIKSAGGGHYASITAAATDLVAKGQSGPVIFDVYVGAYTGTATLNAVTGNSETNTITLRKASAAGGAVTTGAFNVNAPDYVTIQGFDSIGSNNNFQGGATNGLIENTTITVPLNGRGIIISGAGNHNLTIRNVTITVGTDAYGVYSSGQSNNLLIERCQIIGNTMSFSGIALQPGSNYGGSTGIIIRNNIIRGAFDYEGIALSTTNDFLSASIFHNAIRMNANESWGINLHQTNSLTADVRNNIVTHYGTTATSIAIRRFGNPTLSANHNLYYVPNGASMGYLAGGSPVAYPTLTAWRTAYPGLDAQSLSEDPDFVSATDLHILPGSPADGAGAAVGGITTDYDGDSRGSPPAIGADEIP